MKQRYREFQIEATDDKNYEVNRIGVVKDGANAGKETLKLVGYYNNIENAVKEIARLCGNKADDLHAWLVEYRNVKTEIENIINGKV